ncbi:MAG: insulinase family protein [Bacteroidales bacterium]|nr:insulinase family protein [Bacteroidales bacterium]
MKKVILFLAAAAALALSGCSRYESVKGDPLQAKIYTLDNGLKVYMTVNKDEPRIQANIAVRAGGKDDPADNTGLAHYLEHMMFKGTQQFGTQDYAAEKPLLDQVDSLYEVYRTLTDPAEREALYHQIDSISYEASKIAIPNEYDKLMSVIGSEGTNAYTSEDVTCYIEEIPSNQIENWAKIQADRFKNCVFRGFHTELEAVYEEKNMSLTDDGEKAFDALNAMLFPNHPYGTQTVIGTQDHLKNPSLKAIRHQKDTYYVPNNVAICLSGDFDPDYMVKIIEKYFGDWQPNPDLPKRSIAAEEPITEPRVKDVYGQEAEFVEMGWRTPRVADHESEIGEIVSSVFYNGQAGLLDLDVFRTQQLLDGYVFNYGRSDWGLFLLHGQPKEGQSLEAVRDIFLAEVEKLRNGDFPAELVEAAKANWKLRYMYSLEHNRSRAGIFVDSFINGTSWEDEATKLSRIEAVTKSDVVTFAKKYLGADSYACVFKHIGEDKDIKKIEAPKITPIVTNRDKQSVFLASIAASEPEPIEPVFVDWEKDMTVSQLNGLELLYKKNEKNDIAQLSFRYDKGSQTDPVLDIAADYWNYLGSEGLSGEEYASKMYGLACSGSIRVGDNNTVISLVGLDENVEAALSLTEGHIGSLIPDGDILSEMKADIFRSRADMKMNQRACSSALRNYVMYGPEYVKSANLSNAQVSDLTAETVLASLKDLTGSAHTILYYGPASLDQVKAMLSRVHATKGLKPLEKTYRVKRLTPEAKVFVAQYNSRQFNYTQYSDRGEKFDISQVPALELFNEYFGGGMNAIVFQEMRESRALAYSAGARLDTPAFADDTYSFRAYIASQNDKLQKAVEGFDEIIGTMPQSPENLEIAKAGILSRLRTQRYVGNSVLYSYLAAKELGIDQPLEKLIFEKVGSMTMDDLLATHKKWIEGRTYQYGILGDVNDMDMAFLRTLGPVEIVSAEDIFGY